MQYVPAPSADGVRQVFPNRHRTIAYIFTIGSRLQTCRTVREGIVLIGAWWACLGIAEWPMRSSTIVEFAGRCDPDLIGNTCVVAESCKHGPS